MRAVCSDKILLMQLWALSQTEDKTQHKVSAPGLTVDLSVELNFFPEGF